MATPVSKMQTIYQDVLANYLISMARTVESSVGSALDALLRPNLEAAAELSSRVFLVEPRVNEMEILIDDHAVRMLRTGLLDDEEIRRVVASQKIANDLERIGDLAVNISERVISLAGMNVSETPRDLEPMAGAVRGMLGRSLGALIFRNVVLAGEVLEADDVVDRYRDQIFEHLLHRMTEDGRQAAPQLAVRAGHAVSRAHRGPRHEHCRGHYFLGAGARRAPRALADRCRRSQLSGEENGKLHCTILVQEQRSSCCNPTPGRRSPGAGPSPLLLAGATKQGSYKDSTILCRPHSLVTRL